MIAIIDYGMGNLGSIHNMLNHIGVDSVVTSKPKEISAADKLILPGVGAFDHAMESIASRGLHAVLDERVRDGVPLLGICLGMQLLTKGSEEGKRPGFGWIDARTKRFRFSPTQCKLPVPHMGWNRIAVVRADPIFREMYEEPRFYFVHSYYVECANRDDVLAETVYGAAFHSAIVRGNVRGTQFHPEKSHKFGFKLLDNFSRL